MQKLIDAEVAKTEAVIKEANEVRENRDQLFEEKFKVEEVVDSKDKEIQQLELEMQRAREEVIMRKDVIESMSKNLIEHETESRDMASKLTLMKNQIMENDCGVGMSKKYGAVKIGTIRHTPCTIEFSEQGDIFFCIIDSKAMEISINCENIDSFTENPDN